MPRIVCDFETANTEIELKVVGAHVYAEHWATEIFCLRWRVQGRDGTRLWIPGQRDHQAAELGALARHPEFTFVAHNVAFEKAIWRGIMVRDFGFPDVPNERWECTQANSARLQVPQALDKGLAVLGIGEKDMIGSKLTRSLSRIVKTGKRKGWLAVERTPDILNRVYEYCEHDVDDEIKLLQSLPAMPADERAVWLLDQTINERGVRLDLPLVSAAQRVVERATVPLVRRFAELTGGIAPTQRDKVLQWVISQGVRLPNLQKGTLDALLGSEEDEDEDDKGLPIREGTGHNSYLPAFVDDDGVLQLEAVGDDSIPDANGGADAVVPLPDHVRGALAIRRLVASASIKKLGRMAGCACSDGRSRGLLNYHGAGTGRWAGRLWQPQNFPRGTVKLGKYAPDPDVLVGAIMSGDPAVVEALGCTVDRGSERLPAGAIDCVLSALRHCVVAGPGRVLAAGDFAGVEMRIVLALAGQHDKCELLATGKDVYLDMADDIYSRPKGYHDKEQHVEQRTIGKNTVLGCGFGMGWRTFQSRYAKTQPKEFVQRVISAYRDDWAPEVPKLWAGLEEAALNAVQNPGRACSSHGVEYLIVDRWLRARWLLEDEPSCIWYRDPQPVRKAMPWSTEERPDVRDAWTCRMTKNGKPQTVDMYGGILTENIVQHLARQQMVHAMKLCERAGLPVVLTVHDEIIVEPDERRPDICLILKHCMEDKTPWARQIKFPLAADTWKEPAYRYRKG
jgi:DNA polymerase